MPIVSENDARLRLNSDQNLLSFLHSSADKKDSDDSIRPIEPEIVPPKKRKRNLSPYEKTLIGISATVNTTKETAAQFGVSASTVQRITNSDADTSVDKAVRDGVKTVNEKAVNQLLALFGVVEKKQMIDKVSSMREAMSIAKDVAAVIEKTTPKQEVSATAQVIVMVPPERSLRDYEEQEAPIPVSS